MKILLLILLVISVAIATPIFGILSNRDSEEYYGDHEGYPYEDYRQRDYGYSSEEFDY